MMEKRRGLGLQISGRRGKSNSSTLDSDGITQAGTAQEMFERIKQAPANKYPAAWRAQQLSQMISSISKTELHVLLPDILGYIFAVEGWHKDKLEFMFQQTKSSNSHLLELLSPTGAMLSRIMELASEPGENLTYVFNETDMPFHTQHLLRSDVRKMRAPLPRRHRAGGAPVSPARHGGGHGQGMCLDEYSGGLLSFAQRPNIFQYYMMEFASALLKRTRNEKVSESSLGVYIAVLKSYLQFFFPLPVNGQVVSNVCGGLSTCVFVILSEFWVDWDVSGVTPVTLGHVAALYTVVSHIHALQSPVFRELRDSRTKASDLDMNALVLPHTRMYSFLHFALANVKDDVFDSCMHLWLAYNRPWYYRELSTAEAREEAATGVPNPRCFTVDFADFVLKNLPSYTTLLRVFFDRVLNYDLRCNPSMDLATMQRRYARLYRVEQILGLYTRNRSLCQLLRDAERDTIPALGANKPHMSATGEGECRLFDTTSGALGRYGSLESSASMVEAVDDATTLHHEFAGYVYQLHTRVARILTDLASVRAAMAAPKASPPPSLGNLWGLLTDAAPTRPTPEQQLHDKLASCIKKLDLIRLHCEHLLPSITDVTANGDFGSNNSIAPYATPFGGKGGGGKDDLSRSIYQWRPNHHMRMLQHNTTVSAWKQPSTARTTEVADDASLAVTALAEHRPWSQPYRSHELPLLVRGTYYLSRFLNSKFEHRPWLLDDEAKAAKYLERQEALLASRDASHDTSGQLDGGGGDSGRPVANCKHAAFVVLLTTAPRLDMYASMESIPSPTQYVLWISCDGKSYRQNIGSDDGTGCTLDGRISFVDPFELVHYYRNVPYCIDHSRGQVIERYLLGHVDDTDLSSAPLSARLIHGLRVRLFPVNFRHWSSYQYLAQVVVTLLLCRALLSVGWLLARYVETNGVMGDVSASYILFGMSLVSFVVALVWLACSVL
eukprot:m.659765 g.659765  ORF g.659765 m.659765 type:complete len:951 (-) comp22726_c0_seq1:2365-5217(-)